MTADPQAVLEAWKSAGVAGVRDTVWPMTPADQIHVFIDLYNRRELDVIEAIVPDDFVHDMRPTGLPGMEVYRGPAAYRRFLEDWFGAFPETHLVVESVEEAGDRVLAIISQEMRGAESGVPVSFQYAALLGFRDGRTFESEFHTDLARARARFAELVAAARR